jgi:FAD/FMN-containing dehydrogenase/Fe-S oxidoreductase
MSVNAPADALTEMESFLDKEGIEARFDDITLTLYSTDASNHQIRPLGVAFPRNRDQVAAIVSQAAAIGLPLLPRGAGTSLGGQAVGACLILDTSRYLNRVGAVDPEGRTAIIEPGVVCQALNDTLAATGLKYGPDPASADRATFGGMIGNNATGSHSVRFGMTSDHVLEATVVLGDGSLTTLRPLEIPEARRQAQGRGTEASVYRVALGLRDSIQAEVADRWPRTWRRSSGYGLNYLCDFSPGEPAAWFRTPEPYLVRGRLNLPAVLAGSEGTLAIVVEACVGLVPRPRATALLLIPFQTVADACEATVPILENEPSAVELIPATMLERARRVPAYARRLGFLEDIPPALLAVEFDGDEPAQAKARAERTGIAGVLLADARSQASFWAIRKAGLGLLMSVPGDAKAITFIEDVAVPVDRLAEYVRKVDGILADHGTSGEWYAHASAGCLHLRPMINLKSDHGRRQMRAVADDVAREVFATGGAISGEHGDGLSHTEFNERLFGPVLAGAFRALKRAFDPAGILNPGKVVVMDGQSVPRLDEALRYNSSTPGDAGLSTHFAYRTEQGFLRAIEACSGMGVCRKDGGVMCPSFQATREERDSTRGRANALRAALSGWLPRERLYAPEMHAVLDLCLECKGCKAECPTGVDMARLKAEYLALVQLEKGVPARSRLFGRLAAVQNALRWVAPIHNGLRRWGLFRRGLEGALGIDARRTIPGLRFRRFRDSVPVLERGGPSRAEPALLFIDTFTDLNEPAIGEAALRVLKAAGLRVGRAPHQVCCGRPMISKGMLIEAKALARANIEALAPYAEAGIPILGLEPSCLLTLRDEYIEFFPDDPRARAVASATRLLEELLVEPAPNGRPRMERIAWDASPGPILVHNHCHARALVGSEPMLAVLGKTGRVRESSAGCCGMAGSFGYEKEHYDLSMRIGEQRLFPEVRSAIDGGAVVVAPGMSCRTQLKDGVGLEAVHPAVHLASRLAGR